MTALSDYLESGLLHHIFRGQSFTPPGGISIALCSGIPKESDSGETIPELPDEIDGTPTGYSRKWLGDPKSDATTPGSRSGDVAWSHSPDDYSAGSGVIKNRDTFMFNNAVQDWGWVSGIAICDSGQVGSGNLLMYAQLNNPRIIYQGDTVKFDTSSLQISFK